jgi:hypothetical protein
VSDLPATAALERALHGAIDGDGPVRVVERRPNPLSSTFPSEIVRCASGAAVAELLLKYDLPWTDDVFGLPAGPRYELTVYREAVVPSGLPAPRAFGVFEDPESGARWLAVEFLADGVRLGEAPHPESLVAAAEWIGRFHRHHEAQVPGPRAGLNRLERARYAGCAQRTREHSAGLLDRHPWLPDLCDAFVELAEEHLLPGTTVVHGEFYPKNVLVRAGRVHPIDWERAAVATGEIDLAALTEGWRPDAAALAGDAYARARWPDGAPSGHPDALRVARMYLHTGALGASPRAPHRPGADWRFAQLGAEARRIGLAPAGSAA